MGAEGGDDLDALLQSAFQELKIETKDRTGQVTAFDNKTSDTCEDFNSTLRNLLEKMENPETSGEMQQSDLDGIMEKVMLELTDENLLAEPFTELASKYPEWIARNRSSFKDTKECETYEQQCKIVQEISRLLSQKEDNGKSTDRRKQILKLMEEMQELGNPPEDLLSELGMGATNDALPDCAQM